MDFNEYQSAAAKTAIYPHKVDDFGLAYCALKLTGEANEVVSAVSGLLTGNASKADVIKECGDVCWYVAMMAKELGIEFWWTEGLRTQEWPPVSNTTLLLSHACQISEKVGKVYRDRGGVPTADVLHEIRASLDAIVYAVMAIAHDIGVTFDDILIANIAKLTDRQQRGVIKGSGDER